MSRTSHSFERRAASLRLRIEDLSSLRKTVALPADRDIDERQWFVVESELKAVEIRLSRRLKRVMREYFSQLERVESARILNGLFGEISTLR